MNDTAEITDKAHAKTVRKCRALKISVNCKGCEDCDPTGVQTHYSDKAQDIFNKYFDEIEANTI